MFGGGYFVPVNGSISAAVLVVCVVFGGLIIMYTADLRNLFQRSVSNRINRAHRSGE